MLINPSRYYLSSAWSQAAQPVHKVIYIAVKDGNNQQAKKRRCDQPTTYYEGHGSPETGIVRPSQGNGGHYNRPDTLLTGILTINQTPVRNG